MSGMAFIDLQAQRRRIEQEIAAAVDRVLKHGAYVMGPEVKRFEDDLVAFCGAKHAIACANGTDALTIPLMAWEIGPGDAVFTPTFTFAATAEVVALAGAEPVMVDVLPDTFNLDADDLDRAIERTKHEGRLTPKAVIAVDLFGQLADYERIAPVARRHGLKLIADSAQGFGALHNGRHPIDWADVVTTSFFPAKPLGCYGDGGALFTNDDALAAAFRSIRIHGQGVDKYDNARIGINSRLDTLQAAILIEKLKIFPDEIERREIVAARYSAALEDIVTTPFRPNAAVSTWAQYTIKADRRDDLAAFLKDRGVPTAIYYAKPLHQQTAYREFPRSATRLPIAEKLADEVISLPMHPYLSAADQNHIVESIRAFYARLC